MRPEDFFKTIEENEDSRKDEVLNRYIEKVVSKHFEDCIDRYTLRGIINDPNIAQASKQVAIREMSEGILKRIYFFNTKTDVHTLVKKGKSHDVVKELIHAINEYGCDILIFPIYKTGNWVAHGMGMSPVIIQKPRIIIPGDGVSVIIQDITTFIKEYK